MSAHRYQATWRSITFNRRFDDSGLVDDPAHLVPAYVGSDYYLEQLDPTSVQTVDYHELRQLAEGAEANQAFEGVRTWLGRGRIIGTDPADLDDKTWAMYEAFSPAACRVASAALTPPNMHPFDFRRATAGGSIPLRFYGRPSMGRPLAVGRIREGLIRPFMFGLMALDSRVFSQAEQSVALGALTGGNNTVSNLGNVYSHPTIEVVLAAAGGSTVTVTNVTTGQTFALDLSGQTAGTFLIDCQRATITKAGVNKYGVRKTGFLTPFVLAPGANTITWSVDTGTASVTFKWRHAYA